MFDKDDPSILWVTHHDADNGNGTYESPFPAMERALSVVRPGNTIALKAGTYPYAVTFQICGTLHQPIRISGEEGVIVQGACWFFYDVNNLIVANIGFHEASHGAISVIGSCGHNRFERLRFVNCGLQDDSSCTLFFGGSGGSCNVVEQCRFERNCETGSRGGRGAIALMVSEGDGDSGAPITNHVFRKNQFVNYGTGIVVGSGDAPAGQYGHIVEYNSVEQCTGDGIIVKCGDTTIRGNLVRDCRKSSIAVTAGSHSVIIENRIMDSEAGVRINGPGHTVENNCMIRCQNEAIRVCGAFAQPGRSAATNLFIEHNTLIDCGTAGNGNKKDVTGAGIRIDAGTSGIVRKNLFSGQGALCINDRSDAFLLRDNRMVGAVEPVEGVIAIPVAFKDSRRDDYSNDSGFGASGWMLTPDVYDPHADDIDAACDYRDTADPDGMDDETGVVEPAHFESFMGKFYQSNSGRDGGNAAS
ncbi:MAG: right-handed parallel beta-helix repeat-containing protein [Chitinispirillaceae bacterium]|nr:right-handed parallel beta-helix repeat-containing protein [Chitinispirillaceae bacterium]